MTPRPGPGDDDDADSFLRAMFERDGPVGRECARTGYDRLPMTVEDEPVWGRFDLTPMTILVGGSRAADRPRRGGRRRPYSSSLGSHRGPVAR
jgi:hypothetical protein